MKVKVLTAVLIADALAAARIFAVDDQLLTWWLLANAAAITTIVVAILFRRKAERTARKPGRHSFSEHQKMHRTEHRTMNGEVVKSGGERMIADYFFKNKIRYKYEKPATGTSDRVISRPDFYLPDYGVFVEYWGMVDTENGKDRKDYQRGMEWKMDKYREAGIKFISIYPKEIEGLDSVFWKKLKEATGERLGRK